MEGGSGSLRSEEGDGPDGGSDGEASKVGAVRAGGRGEAESEGGCEEAAVETAFGEGGSSGAASGVAGVAGSVGLADARGSAAEPASGRGPTGGPVAGRSFVGERWLCSCELPPSSREDMAGAEGATAGGAEAARVVIAGSGTSAVSSAVGGAASWRGPTDAAASGVEAGGRPSCG
ncbi:hypothetical protein BSZ37_04575 [Rubrivirga marina]|uniref:Uncharacterized protein n=1 Tax=Rubrivirga marina TaxID=1196024 RepID=A0A271IY89_9BACT|nr:hypothetical protein BSZ37_04575 [Rubrivirga marina]